MSIAAPEHSLVLADDTDTNHAKLPHAQAMAAAHWGGAYGEPTPP
jgi:hypothetical protein